MTQEENILLAKCTKAHQELARIVGKYQTTIGDSPAILAQLSKTENRSREYVNGTFIVLVVGPVKSGKSTLVNLIAHAYVSPTHFLECTVRPSVISQRREGEDCKITVFTCDTAGDRAGLIDAIIDRIRGIEGEEPPLGVSKAVFDLTPENIREKVELGLNESLSAETLVTSITTPGGRLMKQNVFIIDMPGFDGEQANIDNPAYDTIAQRADLIIFVQSSNSAISKVSTQFLRKLSDNNKDVPVCLIHNIFDSAWWRTAEERATAVQSQKEFAIKEIRRLGFSIDENQCFSINLGMVEDGRKKCYPDCQALNEEVQAYERIEDILHERVISRRDAMRLNVCLGRTRQQLEKTIATIDQELARRHQLAEQYEQAAAIFSKTEATLGLQARKPLTADYNILRQLIRDEARSRISLVNTDNNHQSDSKARKAVVNFIEACEESVSATLGRCLAIDLKEEELALECRERIGQVKEAVISCGAIPQAVTIDRIAIGELPDISLERGVDLDLLIPRKPRISLIVKQFGGHSAEDVVGYLNKAAERLAGSLPGDTDHIEGYIEKEAGAIRPVLLQVNAQVEEAVRQYDALCQNYCQQSKKRVLEGIIADKTAFDAETEQIVSLQQELSIIKQRI